jgi:hypothetical protein
LAFKTGRYSFASHKNAMATNTLTIAAPGRLLSLPTGEKTITNNAAFSVTIAGTVVAAGGTYDTEESAVLVETAANASLSIEFDASTPGNAVTIVDGDGQPIDADNPLPAAPPWQEGTPVFQPADFADTDWELDSPPKTIWIGVPGPVALKVDIDGQTGKLIEGIYNGEYTPRGAITKIYAQSNGTTANKLIAYL